MFKVIDKKTKEIIYTVYAVRQSWIGMDYNEFLVYLDNPRPQERGGSWVWVKADDYEPVRGNYEY